MKDLKFVADNVFCFVCVDHYRLMEALACGPLVVADRMLAPPKGLIHNHTIVFFDDVHELPHLIQYYLEHEELRLSIAERGWKLVMSQHRAWHRIEELLFGEPLTKP